MLRISQVITLPDGRVLGFDEYGERSGLPVFYFHGTPSSRLEFTQFGNEALAQTLGLRVIAVDRPGMGLSDFQPGRRIGDWPHDVAALADELGLERFVVLSYSGGGPYALACAWAMPERVIRVGAVSSPAQFDLPGLTDGIPAENLRVFAMARHKPALLRLTYRLGSLLARYAPERAVANVVAGLPEPDLQVMTSPEFQQGFLRMFREVLRSGPRGAQWDTCLMVSPWDIGLQQIRLPVRLWHGDADRNAPLAMGRYLAQTIPGCQIEVFPGEGHISLIVKHAEEILRSLTE